MGVKNVEVNRGMLIDQIEKMLSGQVSREDVGWWAYDLLLEKPVYERGFEKLLEDVVWALHYFHDTEPMMQQFYPEIEDITYFLKCLKSEELYNRSKVLNWRV